MVRHQEALGHLLYGTGQYGGFVQDFSDPQDWSAMRALGASNELP